MNTDLETVALAAYQRASIDPEDPPGPHTHAELAGVTIRYDAAMCIGAAAYDSVRDIIWVRPGLAPHVEGLRIYHELAERELRHVRLQNLRDSRGEPFCQVSHGLHHGAPSPDADKMIDELLAWMAAR